MDKLITNVESVGVLRKELKAFINAVVKSKFFMAEDNSIKLNVTIETTEGKKENDIFSVEVGNKYTSMEFWAEVPKKVSKKIDTAMFEKMTSIYAKRKTPIKITIEFKISSAT